MEGMTLKPTRNNIIVKNPVTAMNTALEITDEARKEYEMEQLAKAQKAEVVAMGPGCTDAIKVGDFVMFKAMRFMSADPIEGGKYLLFTEGDVIAIY